MNHPILLIFDEESNMWEPRTSGGYNGYVMPSKLTTIINDLIYFSQAYDDAEILKYNKQLEDKFFEDFRPTVTKPKRDLSGFVYVLACGDKYKVGYSKDVSRRIKQLDTRPFELKLVYKQYSECAYIVEQQIHKQLQEYKVANEWYDISVAELMTVVTSVFDTVEKEICP